MIEKSRIVEVNNGPRFKNHYELEFLYSNAGSINDWKPDPTGLVFQTLQDAKNALEYAMSGQNKLRKVVFIYYA